MEDAVETNHQNAMRFAAALCGLFGCQADINVLPTSDFWSKLIETYCKKFKPDLNLTISNIKSFQHFAGRLVASYIYSESNLHCHFNSLGAHIWVHQWGTDKENGNEFIMRCFHGQKMVSKPVTYKFSASSEEGARALITGEGKAEKGKNQKDIVTLTNFSNVVCPLDKDTEFPIIHAPNSCGVNFGNKDKAKQAFLHNVDWTAAMFPKANKAEIESKMIIITKCLCNFGHESLLLGRQLCKITAYEIPGSNDLEEDPFDEMLNATAKHKFTFVFQCCNPLSFKAKAKTEQSGKHCDFKISMIDVRQAIKLSKEIWNKLRETLPEQDISAPKIQLPIFSFDPKKHSFKNAIVVKHDVEEEENDAFC